MRASSLTLALSLLLSPAAFAQEAPDPAGDASQAVDADAGTANADAADAVDVERPSSRVPLQEIRRYVGVFNAVREAYVEPVDDRELMSAAIRGLLLDLDPHSVYMEKETAEAFDEGTSGAYGGIGVEVLYLADGSLRVIAAIDDTPAAAAGLRAGDVIVSIDGRVLSPDDHDSSGPLRGEPGTTVVLGVLRDGETAPLEISVERQVIHITSVRSRMLEPGYGYVRISQFQADTASDFAEAVEALEQDAGGSLRGLLIDLRSNPGGLLTAAVQIADDLLDSGTIVSTRGRIAISDAEFNATRGDLLDGAPVVVLVDVGSASASEVLAGALRDNHRARIVGSRTFGKGSVQTVLPLDNGDSVKLTTARYFTPSGRSIQARGIEPDIVLRPEGAEDGDAPRAASAYTEANLPGHLQGDEEDATGSGEGLPGDAPIQAALEVLKQPWDPDAADVEAVDGPERDRDATIEAAAGEEEAPAAAAGQDEAAPAAADESEVPDEASPAE